MRSRSVPAPLPSPVSRSATSSTPTLLSIAGSARRSSRFRDARVLAKEASCGSALMRPRRKGLEVAAGRRRRPSPHLVQNHILCHVPLRKEGRHTQPCGRPLRRGRPVGRCGVAAARWRRRRSLVRIIAAAAPRAHLGPIWTRQASLTAAGARWGMALVSAEICRCPSSSPSVRSLLPRSRYPPWRRLLLRSSFIVEDRRPPLRGIAAIATRKDIISAVVQDYVWSRLQGLCPPLHAGIPLIIYFKWFA